MLSRLLFLCSLLFLAAATGDLRSQLRDIRLAPELRDYSLPAEAQIQSVASHGDRHLVAWATTAFDADSSVINVLWMRLLDGATPLLENRIVHSPQARPYGFVLVIASGEQFLVFFNDRRADAPGTYVQRIDRNGNRIGGEERIDIGEVKNDTINKPKSEISALTYTSLPGWTFVQIDSARPFIVRDDAVVDTRPIAIEHTQGAYYLAEDTSVVVLREKTLHFYRNLFDAKAERSVAVPQLDSALEHSQVVMRDSNGRYRLMFAVVDNPKKAGARYWETTVESDSVTSLVHRYTDSIFLRIPPSYLYYKFPDLACYGASRVRGCDNHHRIVIRYLAMDYYEYKGTVQWRPQDNYPFYTTISSASAISRMHGLYKVTPDPICPATLLLITRQADSQTTHITLIASSDTTRFTSSTAFIRPSIARSAPNLFRDSIDLLISWRFNGESHRSQAGHWTPAESQEPVAFVTPLSFGTASRHSIAYVEGIPSRQEGTINLNGMTYAFSRQHRFDTVHATAAPYEKAPVETTYLQIQALTSKGWKNIFVDAGYGGSFYVYPGKSYPAATFGSDARGYDALLGAFAIRIHTATYTEYHTEPSVVSRIYAHRALDSAALKYIWTSDHQRLSPDRWLRWSLADDSTRWTFDVVDTAGTIYHTRTLRFDGDPRSIFITQNYPDRSMAIIRGGVGGVRGTFLSHSLDVLEENVQISETRDSVSYPSAAYRNDTLFVAWEDYRNGGIADVYGSAFTGAPKASGVEMTTQDERVDGPLQLWPNPADDEVRIAYPQTRGEGTVSLHDALGRLCMVRSIPPGSIGTTLATGSLDAGIYLVAVRVDGVTRTTRCVVSR